ncbi:MAG: DUF1320 family protein [Undibacterium sp.]|nr:DUF1320 family protein [Undibacterium sp.]
MSYCAKSDMIAAFGEEELIQLTDRQFAATVDESVLALAIAAAEAEINIWLAGSYTLPLSSVPAVLTRMACDFTRYILSGDIAEDHAISIRYRDQMKKLQAIASGKASLGLDQAGTQTARVDLVQIAAGRNDFGDRSSW